MILPGENISLRGLYSKLAAHKLPRWQELPDIELYMDQVLALVTRYLGEAPGRGERPLTAAMVNNYVKMGVVPAPRKKKYSRVHLAHFLVICVLKSSIPISAIRKILQGAMKPGEEEKFYSHFCGSYEQANAAAAESAAAHDDAGGNENSGSVLSAALRAQAEQALASEGIELLFPNRAL